MTRDDIAANIASNLNDANLKFFTSTDINDSIQDAYDEVSAFAMQIEKSASVSIVADLSYYRLPDLIPDYLATAAVYNNTTKQWLFPTSSKALDKIRWDWENWKGEPRWWFTHSWDYLGIAPKKATSSGSLTIYYRAQANTLSGSDTPLILNDSVKVLELYPTADLLTQAQEYKKAKIYFDHYHRQRVQYANDVKSMAHADRIYGLKG